MEAGARFAGYTMLRLPHSVKDIFTDWLEVHVPARKARVLSRIRDTRGGHLTDPRFGSRMRGEGPVADLVAALFRSARDRVGIPRRTPPLSNARSGAPAPHRRCWTCCDRIRLQSRIVSRRAVPRVTRPSEPNDASGVPAAIVPAWHSQSLDPVIHERLRLAIVHALAVNPSLTFTQLRQLLGMTDGNLSVHAKRLEEVGYVESHKTALGRSSQTRYVLTVAGRRALSRYLDHLEAIVATVRPAIRQSDASG